MFPPTAYLLGWYGYRCYIERKFSRPLLLTLYFLGMAVLACNAIPLHEEASFFRPAILWGSCLLAAALFLPAVCLWRHYYRAAFIAGIVTMTAFSWAAFGFIIPQFKGHVTSYDTAQILPDVYDGHSMLYIEKFLRPGISYYSGMYGREWDPVKDPDLKALLQTKDKIFLIMSKSTFHKLAKSQHLIDRFGIAAETPTQVILINHP